MSKKYKNRIKYISTDNSRENTFRPERLPLYPDTKLIRVFVEGYEDVAFWRGIFDNYETERLQFEISVPPRPDLAKGKKVLMQMANSESRDTLLCMDSDFDYLFDTFNDQSSLINSSPNIFHTYAYSTENYLCYAPSLHNVCVKTTKTDMRIFNFVRFLQEYSRTIYPLFVWYAYSASLKNENVFTLVEFKSNVKLNYLDLKDNGRETLSWLERQVKRKRNSLENDYPDWEQRLDEFSEVIQRRVDPSDTYLYMQGHALMDNVVMVMLNAVCEQLKQISADRISASLKTGQTLRNEISNYNNSLRNVRDVLLDNENYKDCPLYQNLHYDIEDYLQNMR